MRRLYIISTLFLFIAGCSTEESIDTAQPATFVRYFNGGNSDEAVQVLELSDQGFIILANTTIGNPSFSKIKLIRVDVYGNLLWTRLYPSFDEDTNANGRISRKGYSIITLESGGYVITGEDIQTDGKSNLFVMVVTDAGDVTQANTLSTINSTTGRALSVAANGNYIVLADVSGVTDNIALYELNRNNLSQVWTRYYGDGESTLANKIFLDAASRITWAGSVRLNNASKVRVVQVPFNSSLTLNAAPLGLPGVEEEGNDICRFGFGYAVVGSTTLKGDNTSGDKDLYYQLFTASGTAIPNSSKSFPALEGNFNEVGNAICSTYDGGLFIVGTSFPDGDQGSEYYLTKSDAFGNELEGWPKTYGSRFNDRGVSALQASDRSLIVLGTTDFGGRGTVMLMKLDRNGNIQ